MGSENPWDEVGESKSGSQPISFSKNGSSKSGQSTQKKFSKDFASFDFFSFGNGGGVSPVSFNSLIILVSIAIIFIWLGSGLYIVKQEESGIITRFGKFLEQVGPGLHYKMPYPIDFLEKEAVTRVRVMKIGDDSQSSGVKKVFWNQSGQSRANSENLMLTGDENIVDLSFEVQWKINNLHNFIFNIRDRNQTIQDAAQSAIREVISRDKLSSILTNGRSNIESEAKKLLQEMLDSYNAGVEIVLIQMLKADPPEQVIDAFRDVQTARVDKESEINKAMAYENEVIPFAKGQAGELLEEANGYAVKVVNEAKGNSERLTKIHEQYKLAPGLVKKKIYIDTMESIMENNQNITIIDDAIKNVIVNYGDTKIKTEDTNVSNISTVKQVTLSDSEKDKTN